MNNHADDVIENLKKEIAKLERVNAQYAHIISRTGAAMIAFLIDSEKCEKSDDMEDAISWIENTCAQFSGFIDIDTKLSGQEFFDNEMEKIGDFPMK